MTSGASGFTVTEPYNWFGVWKDLTAEEKRELLRKVLSYPPIAESPALAHFLEFVGERALQNQIQHLKEYVIATQVFNKPGDFDPRLDPIVRVHARRLRERLDEYYRGPGAREHVRIELPKGSYLPRFVPRRTGWSVPAAAWPWICAALLLVAVTEGLLLVPWVRREGDHSEQATLLQPFFRSPYRTIVAFSNDLFLKDNDGNMFRLKPEEKLDLLNRIQTDPKDLLVSPSLRTAGPMYLDVDYSGTGEAQCIFLLTRAFTQRGKPIEVRASSLINPQELRDSNVIFLGSPRENILLSKMTTALDFRFVRRLNPAGRPFLAIENARPRGGEQPLYEARLSAATGNPQEVYALVSSLPGLASNSQFLILAGQSTAGTQGACEYLVSPGSKPWEQAPSSQIVESARYRPATRQGAVFATGCLASASGLRWIAQDSFCAQENSCQACSDFHGRSRTWCGGGHLHDLRTRRHVSDRRANANRHFCDILSVSIPRPAGSESFYGVRHLDSDSVSRGGLALHGCA